MFEVAVAKSKARARLRDPSFLPLVKT